MFTKYLLTNCSWRSGGDPAEKGKAVGVPGDESSAGASDECQHLQLLPPGSE